MGAANWVWELATRERQKRMAELQTRLKEAEKRRRKTQVVYERESTPTWHERLVADEDS